MLQVLFGFLVEELYFISMSHVFGSNTSASSWEPLCRAIQSMIRVYSQRDELMIKHKLLLEELQWIETSIAKPELTKAFPCNINNGAMDGDGNLLPMTVNIYVNNILAAAAICDNMTRLLAAVIEAIFTVCGDPDTAVHQCSFSLKKWHKLIVGPRQIVLGLVVDTNKMTVDFPDKYIQQVWDLLDLWDPNTRFFKMNTMQKLVRKLV
jgi:hypothetical protein